MRLQGLFYSLLRHFFAFPFQQILAIRSSRFHSEIIRCLGS